MSNIIGVESFDFWAGGRNTDSSQNASGLHYLPHPWWTVIPCNTAKPPDATFNGASRLITKEPIMNYKGNQSIIRSLKVKIGTL